MILVFSCLREVSGVALREIEREGIAVPTERQLQSEQIFFKVQTSYSNGRESASGVEIQYFISILSSQYPTILSNFMFQ